MAAGPREWAGGRGRLRPPRLECPPAPVFPANVTHPVIFQKKIAPGFDLRRLDRAGDGADGGSCGLFQEDVPVVHPIRGLVSEGLMGPPGVVLLEPATQARLQVQQRAVLAQIDFLVLDAAPQPLDEDVVHPPSAPVHADANTQLAEPGDPRRRGELAALIRVEDLGLLMFI